MTNLPEVEVIRKDLEREIVGKRVKETTVKTAGLVSRHRNRPEFCKLLEGRRIVGVSRRGVFLLLTLDEGLTLVVRLGSGSTISRETANAPAGATTQVVIVFTTGGSVHYTDPEKDGELYVVPTEELAEHPELVPVGIDPLADTFTWHSISRTLFARKEPLKILLTDESFIVGLGDLYADEVLWSAGLAGKRRSDSLSAQEVRRLYRSILEVLYEAVKQGGTAEASDDFDDEEDYGDFGDYIKVYGRAGSPCARCRQPIAHDKVDGTDLYWCPQCQT